MITQKKQTTETQLSKASFSFLLNFLGNFVDSMIYFNFGLSETPVLTFNNLWKKSWRYLKAVDSLSGAEINCFIRPSFMWNNKNQTFWGPANNFHLTLYLPNEST